MLSKPNQWRAEWSNSPVLQDLYPSADSYAEEMARRERERSTPAPSQTTETDRLAAIDALALPGTESLVEALKADISITPATAALQIAQEYRRQREQANVVDLGRRHHDRQASGEPPARRVVNLVDLRERAKADWHASVALQHEFPVCGDFVALTVAEAQGRVRLHSFQHRQF